MKTTPPKIKRYGRYENLPPSSVFDQSNQKSKTHQEFKDECNLATIITRFTQTGILYDPLGPMASTIRRGRPRLPEFLDMTQIKSAQDVFDFVEDAQSHFDKLPARLKAVFNNSSEAFLAAINNKALMEDYIRRGVIPPDLFGAAEIARGAGVKTPADAIDPPTPGVEVPTQGA